MLHLWVACVPKGKLVEKQRMKYNLSKKIIVGLIAFFVSVAVNAQARWELGLKGGTDFYLGDANATLFNKIQPTFGAFARWNTNYRWVTKLQGISGSIKKPFDQNFFEVSIQEEFNFFEYGMMNSPSWTRLFSPYITLGIGLTTFNGARDEAVFCGSIPMGVGVKWKVFNKMNIGLEWTIHKLFSDKFDYMDNPRRTNSQRFINNDWYSLATLMVGFDLGNRNSYCR